MSLIPPLPCATGCHDKVTSLLNKPLSFRLNCQYQRGAVLAISLIILLLLTLIGITATQVTGLEEKMAGNLRDRNLAFQAAETALRAGEEETSLSSLVCSPSFVVRVGGFYPNTTPATAADDIPKINDNDFWLTAGKTYNYVGGNLEHVANIAQPKYIIQCLPNPPNVLGGSYYFRITARGTGGTRDAVVILQSVYKRN